MAFGNRKNGSTNDIDMNTNGIQLYNEEGFDPSTLQINYWNQFISFKINPMLPDNKKSDGKKYDYENFVSCLLSPQKAYQLYQALTLQFLPQFIADPHYVDSIGIPAGQALIQISNGLNVKNNKKKEPTICVTIYNNIDEHIKTNSYISYEFRKGSIIKNYDNETGYYDENNSDYSEFEIFILSLKEFARSITSAVAHSIRYTDRFYRAKEISSNEKIMEKLGIVIDDGAKRKGNYSTPFANRRNEDTRTSAPIDSGDIDSVHAELEGM